MMIHENLANSVSRFLNEGILDQEILNNVKPIPKKEKTKLQFLSNYLLKEIQQISDTVLQLKCIDSIQEAEKSLRQHSDVKVQQRCRMFREVFLSQKMRWLNQNYCSDLNARYLQITIRPNQILSGVNNMDRFGLFRSVNNDVCGVLGSTFEQNRNQEPVAGHVLDAFYSANLSDGYVFALGDGCGGHFGDERQDRMISRASHFSTKYVVQKLAAFDQPESLLKAVPVLLQQLTDRLHFKAISEGTTLVAARLYEEGDGYRVVGLSIGDSMLCSWDPHRKQFETVAPARLIVSEEMHQEATAIFPNAFKPEEIHIFDTRISKTAFMFVMSDGGYEFLPVLKNREQYSDERSVDVITLDNEAMSLYLSTLNDSLTASDYVDVLMKKVLSSRENLRDNSYKEADEASRQLMTLKSQQQSSWDDIQKEQAALDEQFEQLVQQSSEQQESEKARLLEMQKGLRSRRNDLVAELKALEAKTHIQFGDDVSLLVIQAPFKKMDEQPVNEQKQSRSKACRCSMM